MIDMNHSCCTENVRYRVSLVPPALPGSVNSHKVVSAYVDYVCFGYVMVGGVVQERLYYNTVNHEDWVSLAEVPFYFKMKRKDAAPGDCFEVTSAAVIASCDKNGDSQRRKLHDFHEEEDIVKICITKGCDGKSL